MMDLAKWWKEEASIQRWENDHAWQAACLDAKSENPYQALHRELTLLRVREPGYVLGHFGIMPKSEMAIAHVRGMLALLTDRERADIVAGHHEKLLDILYDPQGEARLRLLWEYRQPMGPPEFAKENHRAFCAKRKLAVDPGWE